MPERPAPPFIIDTAEYEQERHVFDMCRWINTTLSAMKQLPDPDPVYFERKGRNVKSFLEEALPVAALGLYFYRPGDDVYLRCLTGNQHYDALLTVQGVHNFTIKVEVTTIETEDSMLRRQAMARNGFRFAYGPIERKGRDIVSKAGWVKVTEHRAKTVELAFKRVLDKLEKSYDADTALLVYLDTGRSLPMSSRADLIDKTRQLFLSEVRPDIYGVYYCDAREFLVDGLRPNDVP
jgi:hypothetical protein